MDMQRMHDRNLALMAVLSFAAMYLPGSCLAQRG